MATRWQERLKNSWWAFHCQPLEGPSQLRLISLPPGHSLLAANHLRYGCFPREGPGVCSGPACLPGTSEVTSNVSRTQ